MSAAGTRSSGVSGGGTSTGNPCPSSCGALQVCSSGQCIDVLSGQNLRLESECAGAGSADYLCHSVCPLPASESVQVEGTSGVSYDIVMEISGVVELTLYAASNRNDPRWLEQREQTPTEFNAWGLTVAGTNYYLNSATDDAENHTPAAITYRKTLRVVAGSRIELFLSSSDCEQLKTCDPTCLALNLGGQDIDTQFINVRFLSVTSVSAP